MRGPSFAFVLLAIPLAACGSNSGGNAPDASHAAPDASHAAPDSNVGAPDSNTATPDSNTTTPDGNSAVPDSMTAPDASTTVTAYSCVGQAFPTTAPANITVSGISKSIGTSGTAVLGSVALGAYTAAGTQLATTTSDATTGAYSFTLTTGGSPLDGYLEGKHATYQTTYVYPPSPLANTQGNVPMLMIPTNIWGILPILAGATQSSTDGFIGIEVVDCTGTPVAGAVVTASNGQVRYTRNNLPVNTTGNGSATTTDTNGLALVFHVTPGTVTVGASADGHTYVSHAVNVRNTDGSTTQAVTTTVVAPGPITGLAM